MNALKIQFPKTTFGFSSVIWQNSIEKSIKSYQNLIVPTPMEHEEIVPPAHVWDKIAQILDEQDISKKETKPLKHQYTFFQKILITSTIIILISTLLYIFI